MSKIEVFVRHCHFSSISAHKERLPRYSREKCHQNLMETADLSRVNFTFLLDAFQPMQEPHFIRQEKRFPLIEFKAGSETGSFLFLLDHVVNQRFSDDTIIYFLEDDYLHRPGWVDVMLEGFSLPRADYLTLFDHGDKYVLSQYENLQSLIYPTASCHWRSTPSTTNTYAMRLATLKKHFEIHQAFSRGRKISADHEKFLRLGEMGAQLISSIPGYSTHVEKGALSPAHDWQKYL